jgi:hypothetical protein
MNEAHVSQLKTLYPKISSTTIEEIIATLNSSLESLEEQLAGLKDAFRRQKAVFMPGFIAQRAAETIGKLLLEENTQFNSIKASKYDAKWSISMLDETLNQFKPDTGEDFLSVIMLSSSVVNLICRIAGTSPDRLLTTKRWINRYYAGEFITPHIDNTGDFQTILCLSAPPASHGGQVILRDIGSFDLAAGDMLMFSASSIEHWTSPLQTPTNTPDPIRLTGICRYYIIGGKEPNSRIAIYDSLFDSDSIVPRIFFITHLSQEIRTESSHEMHRSWMEASIRAECVAAPASTSQGRCRPIRRRCAGGRDECW